MDEKEQLISTWRREYETTLKVLKAFPAEKGDWKPHEKSRSAKELAWTIAGEELWFVNGAETGNFSMNFQKPPERYEDAVAKYQSNHGEALKRVQNMSPVDLKKMVKFFSGPKQTVDMPAINIIWEMLMDQIHHRGQMTVYVRMAGGLVPSIYGPSADEPWQ